MCDWEATMAIYLITIKMGMLWPANSKAPNMIKLFGSSKQDSDSYASHKTLSGNMMGP